MGKFGTFWISGKTQSSSTNTTDPLDSQSGQFIFTMPAGRVLSYLAANTNAGSTAVDRNTLKLSDVVLPGLSRTSLLAQFQWIIPTHRGGGQSSTSFPTLVSYTHQHGSVDDLPGHASPADSLNIDSNTFAIGVGIQETSSDNSARLGLYASLISLQLTQSTEGNARIIFSNPSLPSTYLGPSLKLFLQYNDAGFEFTYIGLRNRGAGPDNEITGGIYSLAFTVTGRLINI